MSGRPWLSPCVVVDIPLSQLSARKNPQQNAVRGSWVARITRPTFFRFRINPILSSWLYRMIPFRRLPGSSRGSILTTIEHTSHTHRVCIRVKLFVRSEMPELRSSPSIPCRRSPALLPSRPTLHRSPAYGSDLKETGLRSDLRPGLPAT